METSLMMFSNKFYDVLNWIAKILLPALGVLYAGLGSLWDFPKINEVVGTIAAVDLFLGALLNKAKKAYEASDERFDGEIQVEEDVNGKTTASMVVKGDPYDVLEEKDELVFKVNKPEDVTVLAETPEVTTKPARKRAAPRKKAAS